MRSLLGKRTIRTAVVALVVIGVLLGLAGPPTTPAGPAAARRTARGILFLRNQTLLAELWLADPDGTDARQIAPAVSAYSASPDGMRIAYATQPQNMTSKIEVLDLAGGQPSVVDWSPDWTTYAPVWSPADGIIIYERRTVDQNGTSMPKLWMAKPDGTILGPLQKGGAVMNYEAVWAPNGAKLAFFDGAREEIAIFNFSEVLRWVPLAGEFDWAPDGNALVISAVQANPDGISTQLVRYDLTTEQQTVLLAAPTTDAYTPRWSPDGRTIAFVRRTRDQPRGAIWVIPADGSGPAREIAGGEDENVDPQWSPDGTQLLWTRLVLGQPNAPSSIWVSDLSGAPEMLVENATQARWVR